MAKLYKFKKCDNIERIHDIIETSNFYCADWKSLNDPMEGAFDVKYFPPELRDSVSEYFKKIYDLKCQRKILSLTSAIDEIYMWAHYADGFTGIALEVEVSQEDFNNSQMKVVPLTCSLHKVRYIDAISKIDFAAVGEHQEFVKWALSQKLAAWSVENEYRYLEESRIKNLKITNCIFGMRTRPEIMESLKLKCENERIPYAQSAINRSTSKVWHTGF